MKIRYSSSWFCLFLLLGGICISFGVPAEKTAKQNDEDEEDEEETAPAVPISLQILGTIPNIILSPFTPFESFNGQLNGSDTPNFASFLAKHGGKFIIEALMATNGRPNLTLPSLPSLQREQEKVTALLAKPTPSIPLPIKAKDSITTELKTKSPSKFIFPAGYIDFSDQQKKLEQTSIQSSTTGSPLRGSLQSLYGSFKEVQREQLKQEKVTVNETVSGARPKRRKSTTTPVPEYYEDEEEEEEEIKS